MKLRVRVPATLANLERQLAIASGEPLPWTADLLTQRGHAIEARVYAEDPSQGFIPQAGRVLLYREPRMPGVRIDSGIAEGTDIPVYYDPLLAKVIASAETREAAIARLIVALRGFPILGIRTNIPFLLRIIEHPRFRAGEVDTGFLDGEGAGLAESANGELPSVVHAALAEHAKAAASTGSPAPASSPGSVTPWDPWRRLGDWRV